MIFTQAKTAVWLQRTLGDKGSLMKLWNVVWDKIVSFYAVMNEDRFYDTITANALFDTTIQRD